MRITHADVVSARERIRGGVVETPCLHSAPLSEMTGCNVWVKMDHLQRTGSFKERGARNALLQLTASQKRAGVVAASAGNHALGLAYHGRLLGVPVTVVMPQSAPIVKRASCRRLGAEVISAGENFKGAFDEAQRLVRERGLVYIHGYDDPAIIAGQGTMGLEILDQMRQAGAPVDAIVVPIGGAGLIAGIAAGVKHLSPRTLVCGVEPTRAATFHAAKRAGKPVFVEVGKTIADGLATPDVGSNAFETAAPLVDGLALVDESAISRAVLRLMEDEKSVVEGAGAAGLAALLDRPHQKMIGETWPDLRGKHVVVPLCGGNIDPAMIGRVIERGLAVDGRVTRFVTTISDRPGGLARLANAIARVGASVKDILHDRAFGTSDLTSVDVRCIIETTGPDHVRELFTALEKEGFEVRVELGTQAPDAPPQAR